MSGGNCDRSAFSRWQRRRHRTARPSPKSKPIQMKFGVKGRSPHRLDAIVRRLSQSAEGIGLEWRLGSSTRMDRDCYSSPCSLPAPRVGRELAWNWLKQSFHGHGIAVPIGSPFGLLRETILRSRSINSVAFDSPERVNRSHIHPRLPNRRWSGSCCELANCRHVSGHHFATRRARADMLNLSRFGPQTPRWKPSSGEIPAERWDCLSLRLGNALHRRPAQPPLCSVPDTLRENTR